MTNSIIRPVRTRADMESFIQAAWNIQGGNSLWTPPLRRDVRGLLDTKHPFWTRARRELFLAERNGRVVGRVAAIEDDAFNEHQRERAGAWGFFECERDVETARALFAAAADWCHARALTHMRGPFSPSTNYEIGMLVEGFDEPPVIMMPYNPPWYPEFAEACGLTKEKDLFAHRFLTNERPDPRMIKAVERLRRNPAIGVRHTTKATVRDDIRLMCRLFEAAWRDNWGFTPMNPEEIELLARDVLPILVEDLAFVINYNDEPAAVALLLPDVNPILKRLDGTIGLKGIFKYLLHRHEIRGLRVLLFGITPEYRRLGLPFVLLGHLLDHLFNSRDYDTIEAGWTLEDNDDINSLIAAFGGRRVKRYRIYRQEL